MENGGKPYGIRSEEKRHSGRSELGARAARGTLGGLVPGGAAGLGAPRQGGSSSLGRRAQAAPPRCGKGRFSPQSGSPVGQAAFAPSPWQKRNPIPVLSAPLGFLRDIPGAWLLLLQHFHCLSPSFFHSFPPPLPPLLCALAEHPLPGYSLNGPGGRIIAIAHLHSPSSQSSLLLPSPSPRGAGPGCPGMARTGSQPGMV